MSWIVLITLIVAVTAFLVWASADVRSGIYLGMLCRTTTHRRVVALTFDDGPDAEETPRVLDVLKRHGVRATFFVVGERIEAHPELLLRMLSEGHTIGNHTLNHADMTKLTDLATYQKQIDGWKEKETKAMRIDYIWSNAKVKVSSSNVVFNDKNYPIVSDHYGVMIEVLL